MDNANKHPASRFFLAELLVGGLAIAAIAVFYSGNSSLGEGNEVHQSLSAQPQVISPLPQLMAVPREAETQPQSTLDAEATHPKVLRSIPGDSRALTVETPTLPAGVRQGDVRTISGTGLSLLVGLPPGQVNRAIAPAQIPPGASGGNVQIMPETGIAVMLSQPPGQGQAVAVSPLPPGVQENMVRTIPGVSVRVLLPAPGVQNP